MALSIRNHLTHDGRNKEIIEELVMCHSVNYDVFLRLLVELAVRLLGLLHLSVVFRYLHIKIA